MFPIHKTTVGNIVCIYIYVYTYIHICHSRWYSSFWFSISMVALVLVSTCNDYSYCRLQYRKKRWRDGQPPHWERIESAVIFKSSQHSTVRQWQPDTQRTEIRDDTNSREALTCYQNHPCLYQVKHIRIILMNHQTKQNH